MNRNKTGRIKLHMLRLLSAGLMILFGLSSGLISSDKKALAGSGGAISLTTEKTTIGKGETFTVVCRVTAANGVNEADFYVDYNTHVFKFVAGGAKATKEEGGVHIQSLDNTDSPSRRTFSLQFVSKDTGEATIFIRHGAKVTDSEGASLSLKTDKIEMQITEDGEPLPTASALPGQTSDPGSPAKKPSGNTKIKSISTNAIDMTPDFDPEIRSYDVQVDPETDTFFIDYELASKKATAKISGNKDLDYGINKVKLTVTAENGKKKAYVFMVERLEKSETTPEPEVVTGGAVEVNPPLDKEDGKGYSIILYLIIAFLVVFSIAMVMLVKRQRRELEYYYEEEEREEREAKNDRRSGEGSIEGGEIRGEDREFRYRD